MRGIQNGIQSPALTKQAAIMNGLDTKELLKGIKTASILERDTRIKQREQVMAKRNIKVEEPTIPTGQEIRKAYEEGEYR